MERTELHEVLRLERVFAVAPEKVWRAWTDAEALRLWFGQSEAPDWAAELDVRAGGLDVTFGKQHRSQQMMEHRFAGRAGETLFTELARLIRLAGIEGRCRTTNNGLGGVLAHVVHQRLDG